MVESLTKVSGEEFVAKLLSGERDFSKISLEERFDLSAHEAFQELIIYLKTQDLQKMPVDISKSQVRYVNAKRLHLPYTIGTNTNFRGTNFENANLENVNFESANFGNANLKRVYFKSAYLVNADLWLANFNGANLKSANLENAYLKGANFGYVNLDGANFKGVKNLDSVINLGKANFIETKVTSKERLIIEEALKRINRFVEEGD